MERSKPALMRNISPYCPKFTAVYLWEENTDVKYLLLLPPQSEIREKAELRLKIEGSH